MEPEISPSSSAQKTSVLLGLLGILSFVFGFLCGRSFSRTSPPQVKQYVDSIGNGAETTKQNNNLQPEMRIRAELYTPEDIERKRQRQDKSTNTIQMWLTAGTWLTFIAASVYAGISAKIWHETRQQTRILHDTLVASERPWIKIISVKPWGNIPVVGGLSFQKIGPYKNAPDVRVQATLQIQMSLQNIGHSVADIIPDAELFMPQFSTSEYWNRVSAEEQKFCESNTFTGPRFTVFPDEPQPFLWNAGISAPIHPEDVNHLPQGFGITPSLIVCVNYRHKGLSNLYQTRAVYTISHVGSGNRYFDYGNCNITSFQNIRSPITFCGGGTPANLLRVEREPMADDAY